MPGRWRDRIWTAIHDAAFWLAIRAARHRHPAPDPDEVDVSNIRNWYDQPSIAFDLDGTIIEDRFPDYGNPRPDVVRLMRRLSADGWWIVVSTSRPHPYHRGITEHLDTHDVPHDQVITAAKPNTDLLIDDRGLLPPAHALDAYLQWRRHDDPLRALVSGEHRSAWAAEQDAVPENPDPPEYDDPGEHVVAIPMSGGMDSTTMWGMASEAGVPYRLFYVDSGQEYAAAELEAVADVTGGAEVEIIDAPMPYRTWRHVLSGRNAVILTTIARRLTEDGLWGEVWFGNLSGESPKVGGDKSARFMATMQHLLTLLGHDVRIVNPVSGMVKGDEVDWWAARDRLDVLMRTKTCFHPTARQCGRCQACFRKWVAFTARGHDPSPMFPDEIEFRPHIEKYRRVMTDPTTAARYSPARIRDTLGAIDRLEATAR